MGERGYDPFGRIFDGGYFGGVAEYVFSIRREPEFTWFDYVQPRRGHIDSRHYAQKRKTPAVLKRRKANKAARKARRA